MKDNEWKRASACPPGVNPVCAEVRIDPNGSVQMRNSQDGDDALILTFTHQEWEAFLDGVKAGEFDLPD